MNERKEPTLSSGLSSKENSAQQRRSRPESQQRPPNTRPQTTPSQVRPAPQPQSSGFIWFVFLLTLLVGAAASYSVWQLQLANSMIQDQRSRIIQLENKLALSDDSATQSLASVGAKVRELNVKAVTAESEIDKLWATRNVNRSAIAENKTAVESTASTNKKQIDNINKKLSAVEKEVKALPSKSEMTSVAQRVTEQDLLLQSLRERVANHNDTLKTVSKQSGAANKVASQLPSIEKRLSKAEEAVTSFDAFRLNVNRDLLQLKQTK